MTDLIDVCAVAEALRLGEKSQRKDILDRENWILRIRNSTPGLPHLDHHYLEGHVEYV
jgi:hypothetical protein